MFKLRSVSLAILMSVLMVFSIAYTPCALAVEEGQQPQVVNEKGVLSDTDTIEETKRKNDDLGTSANDDSSLAKNASENAVVGQSKSAADTASDSAEP
ncbi:MAG: hypothetical protein IKF78_07995, partial [Atopobiaceae bacterium]|nr:hypothetical protein [Atopobiaceae bacterium]